MNSETPVFDDETPQLEITTSRQFSSWLVEMGASLTFTTYQAGKLFFIGTNDDQRPSIFERTLERCMGMTVHGNSLYIAGLIQIYRFENALEEGILADGVYDRLYIPQESYYTGDLDIHDIAVDADGQVVFANTLFSCVAQTSGSHSFVPVWQPSFIDKLAAEDRCHLNGLALRDGKVRYVSVVAEANSVDGWRDHRVDGGSVIDVESGDAVVSGLSMPHSPRWHDDKLWLHDSGSGRFGFIDMKAGKFEEVAFCPGYLRGLDFISNFAVVGVSKCRDNKTFSGLPLDDELEKRKAEAHCGVYVVDLKSGDLVHWLRMDGVVKELYDVAVIPGARRPSAIGFKTDEIRRMITVGEEQPAAPKKAKKKPKKR